MNLSEILLIVIAGGLFAAMTYVFARVFFLPKPKSQEPEAKPVPEKRATKSKSTV